MAFVFEEMASLDRPTVEVKVKVGDQEFDLVARKPSYEEQDQIDQFQIAEMRRLLKKTDEPLGEGDSAQISERDRLRQVYTSRPKNDIIEQLLPLYGDEIREIAADSAGINRGLEALKMADMKEDELRAHIEARETEMEPHLKDAKEQVRSRMDEISKDDLVTQLIEMNVNLRCSTQARQASDCEFLHRLVADWPAPPVARKALQAETITTVANEVRRALYTTRPLDKPSQIASDEQSSSQAPSEAVEQKSGDSTEETQTS